MTFDDMAEGYDRWYETPVGATVDRMEKRAFLKLLDPKPGETLLEVGSGTGHWSLWFRSLGLGVMGLEISPGMVAVARRKMAKKGWKGIRLVRGDGRQLPFREASFDMVTAIAALEFIPEYPRVLDEMWRCTRCGGRMVIGVLNLRSFFARPRRREAKHRETVFSRAHFFKREELRRLLGRYGEARIVTSTYLHPSVLGARVAMVSEGIGRIFFRRGGAFLVGRVDKKTWAQGDRGIHA